MDDEEERRLFLIPWLVAFLRWVEEAITALSGYGIIFALAVGVVDLLTDGNFSSQFAWVDYAYAWAMALGIAGQIVGLSSRSARAYNHGRWLRGTAFGLLVLVLAYVEYQAGIIFAFHKSFGTPVLQSLAQLGLTQDLFIRSRTATAVALAVLSGFLRYQPRRKFSIDEIEAENERKARIAASNAHLRTAQLKGLVTTVQAVRSQSESSEPLVQISDDSAPLLAVPTETARTNKVTKAMWDSMKLKDRVLESGVITPQEIAEVLGVSVSHGRNFTKDAGGKQTVQGRSGAPYQALIDTLYTKRTRDSFAYAQKLETGLGIKKKYARQLQVVANDTPDEEAEELESEA